MSKGRRGLKYSPRFIDKAPPPKKGCPMPIAKALGLKFVRPDEGYKDDFIDPFIDDYRKSERDYHKKQMYRGMYGGLPMRWSRRAGLRGFDFDPAGGPDRTAVSRAVRGAGDSGMFQSDIMDAVALGFREAVDRGFLEGIAPLSPNQPTPPVFVLDSLSAVVDEAEEWSRRIRENGLWGDDLGYAELRALARSMPAARIVTSAEVAARNRAVDFGTDELQTPLVSMRTQNVALAEPYGPIAPTPVGHTDRLTLRDREGNVRVSLGPGRVLVASTPTGHSNLYSELARQNPLVDGSREERRAEIIRRMSGILPRPETLPSGITRVGPSTPEQMERFRAEVEKLEAELRQKKVVSVSPVKRTVFGVEVVEVTYSDGTKEIRVATEEDPK